MFATNDVISNEKSLWVDTHPTEFDMSERVVR